MTEYSRFFERNDPWLEVDLGQVYDVHAVQINFADDRSDIPVPGEIRGIAQPRYIETGTR